MKNWFLFLISCLMGCSTHQPLNGTAIDDMNVELHQSLLNNENLPAGDRGRRPSELGRVLMPDIKFHSRYHASSHQRRFDIGVKDVPANVFYMGLVRQTPVSIIVSPEIKGNITLSLKHVTIEQALQALEDTYGYIYNRIPGGYQIVPNTLQTKIYTVNYLELQRSGVSDMRLHSGEVTEVVQGAGGSVPIAPGGSSGISGGVGATSIQGNIGSVHTSSTPDFWAKLQKTVEQIIGVKGGSVTVNESSGVVVVRAYPKELKQVEAYLDTIQNNMDRQVILEAKILEVTLSDTYQLGIDWDALGLHLDAINDFPNTGISLADFPPAFTGVIRWTGDFTTTIRALGTQGTVQVLSSPRVATMNNQPSLIKVGNDEFFVSGITPGQASGLAVAQPTQVITPFFSGITLDVTPQIDAHGNVTLHVHPSISLVTEQTKLLTVGTATPTPTPLAHSTIRESDTVVHAKNGQVVVIGGLMQNQTTEDIAQLPFFGSIPFLGTLVRATKQTSTKTELVILLKATVVNKKTTNRDIHNSTQRIAGLKRGFHIGGRPDVFGTEGEVPIEVGPEAGTYAQPRHKRQCGNGRPRCSAFQSSHRE
jgi:MSHA biogenesis protein MshL